MLRNASIRMVIFNSQFSIFNYFLILIAVLTKKMISTM